MSVVPVPLKNAKAEFSSKLTSNFLVAELLNWKVFLKLAVICENNPTAFFPTISFESSSNLTLAFPSE